MNFREVFLYWPKRALPTLPGLGPLVSVSKFVSKKMLRRFISRRPEQPPQGHVVPLAARCVRCVLVASGATFPPAFSVLSAYWRGKKRRRRGDPRERAREERPYIVPEYTIATGDHREKEAGRSATGK